MTDKWDEISTRLMNEDWPEHLSMRDAVKWSIKRGADALRDAYAEGEKAGMERAATIAERNGYMAVAEEIRSAINTAAETKEPPSPS